MNTKERNKIIKQSLKASQRIRNNEISREEFSQEIAKAMKKISSSNVFFIVQQAFGEVSWDDVDLLLQNMIKKK